MSRSELADAQRWCSRCVWAEGWAYGQHLDEAEPPIDANSADVHFTVGINPKGKDATRVYNRLFGCLQEGQALDMKGADKSGRTEFWLRLRGEKLEK